MFKKTGCKSEQMDAFRDYDPGFLTRMRSTNCPGHKFSLKLISTIESGLLCVIL